MKATRTLFTIALIALLSVACQPTPATTIVPAPTTTAVQTNLGGTLTVFAAASLTTPFTEIGKAFEKTNPGTKVMFNFAGSQSLRTQIEQGAKADVFASADNNNLNPLKTQGLVVGDAPIFTRNRLVVIMPKNNPAGIKSLQGLAQAGLKLDIADTSVPVGNYTLQVLDKLSADASYGADFKTRVLARVVSKENDVKQVVSKVALGEADAGVVYTTDAQATIDKLATIDIPTQYNVIALYPIAVLKSSTNVSLAQTFVDYVLSADGQSILAKAGFAAVQ
ncbi:MAG: molybdate ABC transporter substrate-binding protein [Chloroflexi bacterium]|nr:molybdate ABC transporter substrate-binding protein [Chloroflexota bacterium]